MEVSAEPLAWYRQQGREVLCSALDLRDSEKVKEVFAACKESRGYVTAEGWAFLFRSRGLNGILELDLETGWFHSGKPAKYAAHLIYQSLMSGYNPMTKEKGDYDPDSGLFLSLKGRKEKIDWDTIMVKGS